MSDADDRPVQLLCVKNLRQSLKRRLGDDPELSGPSRRVDYKAIVRNIRWRRVDSAFEADVVYLEAAQRLFPQTYRGMIGFEQAWFIHVNPDANFPRYTKTVDLSPRPGLLIGPIEDKYAAARLIEDAVDWFDLCRYYNILVESPNATACAYKEMGKCPAPCDGSISIEQYRALVEWSARSIVEPIDLVRDNTNRMQAAAAERKYEVAARIKQYVDSLSQLGKGPFRHARFLRDFRFISLQRGPRQGLAKLFLITPGRIEEVMGLIDASMDRAELLSYIFERAAALHDEAIDSIGAERIGLVSHHLFLAKAAHGAFIHLDSIDADSLARGLRDLRKHKPQADNDSEGVVKELDAF
jgi:excinuclease UvrABC nuclease subunit